MESTAPPAPSAPRVSQESQERQVETAKTDATAWAILAQQVCQEDQAKIARAERWTWSRESVESHRTWLKLAVCSKLCIGKLPLCSWASKQSAKRPSACL
jgi:hypothetical protein